MTSRLVAVAIISAAVLGAPTLHAQSNKAAAEALFNEAFEAFDQGDFDTACERFRESDRLDPAAGTKLNLARCEEHRGNVAEAWARYRAGLEALPPNDERVALAEDRISALEARLPYLVVKKSAGAPRDMTVTVGAVELGAASFGTKIPMDPGAHEVLVSAAGYEERTIHVELTEAKVTEVEVGPGRPVKEETEPPLHAVPNVDDGTESSGTGRRRLGFVIGGIGVAGLALGTVAGVVAKRKESDNADGCTEAGCTPAARSAGDAAKTFALMSNIGWGVGAVGLGFGAYFVISSGSSESSATLVGAQQHGSTTRVVLRRTF